MAWRVEECPDAIRNSQSMTDSLISPDSDDNSSAMEAIQCTKISKAFSCYTFAAVARETTIHASGASISARELIAAGVASVAILPRSKSLTRFGGGTGRWPRGKSLKLTR